MYPPPPKKAAKVIVPSVQATNSKPSGAPISIPLWNVDAPLVGAVLFPKYELILEIPGAGHKSSPLSIKLTNFGWFVLEYVGTKNTQIKIVKSIINVKNRLKILLIINASFLFYKAGKHLETNILKLNYIIFIKNARSSWTA